MSADVCCSSLSSAPATAPAAAPGARQAPTDRCQFPLCQSRATQRSPSPAGRSGTLPLPSDSGVPGWHRTARERPVSASLTASEGFTELAPGALKRQARSTGCPLEDSLLSVRRGRRAALSRHPAGLITHGRSLPRQREQERRDETWRGWDLLKSHTGRAGNQVLNKLWDSQRTSPLSLSLALADHTRKRGRQHSPRCPGWCGGSASRTGSARAGAGTRGRAGALHGTGWSRAGWRKDVQQVGGQGRS